MISFREKTKKAMKQFQGQGDGEQWRQNTKIKRGTERELSKDCKQGLIITIQDGDGQSRGETFQKF